MDFAICRYTSIKTASSFLDPVCIPTKGPKAGHPCIFPFTDGGKTCPGPKCCNLDNDSKGSWCSTKVDANGNHVSGNYAYCEGSPCGELYFIRTIFYKNIEAQNCQTLKNKLRTIPASELIAQGQIREQ